ncbi:HutD family protein [Bdellovibrio sp. HCB288]|uniref:HutD/Ves family protein n=1 Tax=Bdellovibrio sp. HCB288 TaxID=3394355 RepID=UPI0039B434D9
MITLLKQSSYKTMPWKNGKGLTAQIAIGPEGATFPDDFFWRISSAQVNGDDPFSNFPGCDRKLVITQGTGLTLKGKDLHPLDVLEFSGEEVIHAKLIEGPVVDLGIIYRRDRIQAEMKVLNLHEISTLNFEGGRHFIFCLRGRLQVHEHLVHAGDCIMIQSLSTLELAGLNHSSYVLISVNEK